ncbi:quinone oxidoreductase family protein [Furfurilactobacillus sp. WILCCON 0119]
MLSIMQTNFNGIDGLELWQQPVPEVTPASVMIAMDILPVVPTDWKRESDPHATHEQLAALPRVIGIGGVGRIVEVGADRDQALLDRRVLVMNPAGSYSQYVSSTNPDFIFPLPETVDNKSAAALTAGPGTALRLLTEIKQSQATNIVITGANSVIGLYLLQMLHDEARPVWPIVSEASTAYFNEQLPTVASYTTATLPALAKHSLIIDITGSEALLNQLLIQLPEAEIVSIALQQFSTAGAFKFVHEDFDAAAYRHFIDQLATGELVAPIDRVFPVTEIKTAQHYAKEAHSRGRVLTQFNLTED